MGDDGDRLRFLYFPDSNIIPDLMNTGSLLIDARGYVGTASILSLYSLPFYLGRCRCIGTSLHQDLKSAERLPHVPGRTFLGVLVGEELHCIRD